MDTKRLFFGFAMHAPWPEPLPNGRLLAEEDRHATVAFLGNIDYDRLKPLLPTLPRPPLDFGPVGYFDKLLLLPPKRPGVAAWHPKWRTGGELLTRFQQEFVKTLDQQGFPTRDLGHTWLPHVTLCRRPFHPKDWQAHFTPLPFYAGDFCLYESLGHSRYQVIWKHEIPQPFSKLDHTADEAYVVRGADLRQLEIHAQIALAFTVPNILPYFKAPAAASLDEVIIALNDAVTRADREEGCAAKAVSFHGELVHNPHQTLEWEMIIDI